MSEQILDSIKFLLSSGDFIELKDGPGYKIDLRYASDNNFVGFDMYGPFRKAYLHKFAFEKLDRAHQTLQSMRPGFGFIIFDALRPRSVQRILWSRVVGTENQRYIANPDKGSLHNFGFAVDLTIMDSGGNELDMCAGFDDFRPIAQPQLEAEFIAKGELTSKHIDNRKVLRQAMESAGFTQLPHEWWHFDAITKAEAISRFQIVE